MPKAENTAPIDEAREQEIPACRFDTTDAICKLDRIIAAVNIAHDAIQPTAMRAQTDPAVNNAWLTLELVQEKLDDFRQQLEDAPSVEVVP